MATETNSGVAMATEAIQHMHRCLEKIIKNLFCIESSKGKKKEKIWRAFNFAILTSYKNGSLWNICNQSQPSTVLN